MKRLLIGIFVMGVVYGLMPGYSSLVEAKSNILKVDDDGVQCPEAAYTTIQDAVDAANAGEKIQVCPGEYDGALVDEEVHIKGLGGATIVGGPAHSSGLTQGFRLLAGSDGSSISHLTFTEDVDLTIMNGDAVNDVTIEHNTFYNQIQAVSNWRGDNWKISHNTFEDLRTRCGGGIAILVGAFDGVQDAKGSVVSHNTIKGTLHVDPDDCGGYNGTGIVLFADYRFGGAGGAVKENRVVQNKIALTSDTPNVVDVAAVELTDTRDDENVRDIEDNAIGFNDLRGTEMQIVLTPDNLDNFNDISRNLGNNRGHGAHPSVFGPGGN